MLKKLLIAPWFGPLPEWIDKWRANVTALRPYGWDFWLYTSEASFAYAVIGSLGIKCPPLVGTRKVGDFFPALGCILDPWCVTYDFWGHTSPDVVFGRLDRFITDELLASVDIFSNDPYPQICGPLTIYRNCPKVNNLFKCWVGWEQLLEDPAVRVFDEDVFSRVVKRMTGPELRVRHEFWQGRPAELARPPYREPDGSLWQHGQEIAMYHIRPGADGEKRWPL